MPKYSSGKPELLAPAGNYEKLETAIHYGADAVYLAGKDFSLRNFSGNFTDQELESAVSYAHKNNVKVYVTCNIFSRNHERKTLGQFLEKIGRINSDAVIISDPGIIRIAKKIIPHIDIHLSTQANTTNYSAVKFWQEIGIKRINLARELTLDEIKDIAQQSTIEIETFIHGAMCISYSGRCLLSSFLTGRDSNRGLCSHPCRWKYAVVEEMRPGEYQPILEDERGTYIFNSKDLCMIDHIPELCDAGISSLKLEGRMKGISYLASVVKTYREAIDLYTKYSVKNEIKKTEQNNETERVEQSSETIDQDKIRRSWHRELDLIYNRTYCTGFYFNTPANTIPNYHNIHSGSIHSFIGKVIESLPDNKIMISVRNKASVGDTIEILPFKGEPSRSKILAIYNTDNHPIPHAQPNSKSILKLECSGVPLNIVRKIS
ncbi:MAG: U32 family peptidase [Desulfamplus sp.]|nr:U32 family peptidase [Desulfamplus sp.]